MLAFGFLHLALRAINVRRAVAVNLSMGGHPAIERPPPRVHANFAENPPVAVLLLSMAARRGAPWWALHVLCLGVLVGRASHAFCRSHPPEVFGYRIDDRQLTFGTLILPT